jgi:hypothetical protein
MDPINDLSTLASRYGAVWNEPDPAVRHQTIVDLWAADAVEFTDSTEHRGHAALEARIAGAYEKLVAPGEYVFVAADDVVGHHNAATFTVHMVPAGGGNSTWYAAVFLTFDTDGRIERDYQFTGPEAGIRGVSVSFLTPVAAG